MRLLHAKMPDSFLERLGMYPFIPVFKGCLYDCGFCYSGEKWSRALCGRGLVSRTPESVIRDLVSCSRDPGIGQAYITADFTHVLPQGFTDKIFAQRYDLNLHYIFNCHTNVSRKTIRKMLSSFKRCELQFVFSEYFHRACPKQTFDYLAGTFDYLRQYKDRVALDLFVIPGNAVFERLYKKLKRINPALQLFNQRSWFIDFPYPRPGGSARRFRQWVKRSRRRALTHFTAGSQEDDRRRFLENVGDRFYMQARFTDALSNYRQALRISPHSPEARIGAVQSCLSLRKFRQAASLMDKKLRQSLEHDQV